MLKALLKHYAIEDLQKVHVVLKAQRITLNLRSGDYLRISLDANTIIKHKCQIVQVILYSTPIKGNQCFWRVRNEVESDRNCTRSLSDILDWVIAMHQIVERGWRRGGDMHKLIRCCIIDG